MNKKYIVSMIVVAAIAISAVATNANAFYLGQTGQDVADLQISLVEKGFDIPAITSGIATPGYFGVQTLNALTAYEASKPSLKLGAAPGPEVYTRTFFNAGLSQGGVSATSSSVATYKITAGDWTTPVIQWTPNLNTTLSIGSSTAAFIPKAGDVAQFYFLNASSTAASTVTFAAVDTMVDLQFAEATGGDLVLNGLDWAKLTFIRQLSGKITVIFDEMTEAD